MSVPLRLARARQQFDGLAHDGATIEQPGELVAFGEPDQFGAMPPMESRA